jgi:hypothetical protein
MNFKRTTHGKLLPAACLVLALAGCANVNAPWNSEDSVAAVVRYHQSLNRMTPAEFARERTSFTAQHLTPPNQVRHAMWLASPRGSGDYARAIGLLEGVIKSNDSAAVPLHPLARLLVEQYNERLKLEGLLDRQGQQLKDSQRKTAELQEKLDSLAEIERSLSSKPPAKPEPRKGKR